MSHARITIACTCAMFLVGSFLAFGSTKDIENMKNEIIETIEETKQPKIQVVCMCECEETTESNSEENNTKVEKENNKSNETIKESNVDIVETEVKEPEPVYISKYVPSNNSFKSYMGYKAITSKSSPQYKLQLQAYTGEYGIRMVEDRYCIALGSYYTSTIGTKVDVVMANGNILKCILGDMKANIHTDSQNIRARDGSVVEFIVDSSSLHSMAKRMGNISYADDKFSGEIKEIRIYQ